MVMFPPSVFAWGRSPRLKGRMFCFELAVDAVAGGLVEVAAAAPALKPASIKGAALLLSSSFLALPLNAAAGRGNVATVTDVEVAAAAATAFPCQVLSNAAAAKAGDATEVAIAAAVIKPVSAVFTAAGSRIG